MRNKKGDAEMKTRLLLAAALLVGLAASAQANSIVGSKHDLSNSASAGRTVKSVTQNQVCVFCHVPHNAITNKLLWNRSNTVSTYKIYTSYNSANMRTALIATTAVNTGSNSLLCLACHSLSSAAAVITNTGNGKAESSITITSTQWSAKYLGADLTNDHPIGIDYSNAVLSVANGFKATPPLRFFGSTGTVMECATCHKVHDSVNGKFLAVNNAGSALCVTCHIK